MEVTDAFIPEVLNATPALPPDDMELLTTFTSDLIKEHMSAAFAETTDAKSLILAAKSVAEVLVANAFLAGRAYQIHTSDEDIMVPMDKDTLVAFIQYLASR